MPTKTQRGDPKLAYSEIIELCRNQRPPVVTTRDLMDEFDISQQAAYYRLTKLEDQGKMERKKIGASGNVWWLSNGDHSS